mgnify:CR=1 FL=1
MPVEAEPATDVPAERPRRKKAVILTAEETTAAETAETPAAATAPEIPEAPAEEAAPVVEEAADAPAAAEEE